ncbi:hypothetical protein BS579_09105, partial [Acinetobacter baumannii]
LVEQRIENPCVPSSILGLATIFEKAPYIMYGAFFMPVYLIKILRPYLCINLILSTSKEGYPQYCLNFLKMAQLKTCL